MGIYIYINIFIERYHGKIAKHTGLPENLIEGLAQGRAEGINEGIMLISKNLKTMGLSVADIIKATGLSEDDIAKL